MNQRTLPIILLNIVNGVGGTLLIPVLPFVVRDLGYGDAVFGLLIAAYPIAQFFGAPILGNLSDHYGRRPILLVSQAGTLLSWFVFALAYFATSPAWALFIIAGSRLVDGITGGNASVANAYLADVTSEEERTQVFGILGASMALALMIGPALGSLAASTSLGYVGAAVLAIVLSTITLIAMGMLLTESLDEDDRIEDLDLNPLHQLNLLSKIHRLQHAKALTRLFTIRGLFTLAFSSYTTVLVLFYADQLQMDQRQVGLLLLAVGSFIIVHEIVFLPRFEKRFGDLGTLVAGLAILPFGLLLVQFSETVPAYLAAAFVLNLGLALTFPTLQSVITKVADQRQEGEVQGIDTSVGAFFSAAAPIFGGLTYTWIQSRSLLLFALVGLGALVWLLLSRNAIQAELEHPEIPPECKLRENWAA